MKPTTRMYEAFILRCGGLTYMQISQRMFITPGKACEYAQKAAKRFILMPSSPANASNRALALHNFPKIAAKYVKELAE